MKIKNVFDVIFSMDNLYLALEDASKGRRYNKDVLVYNLDTWALLNELRQEVLNGTYKIDRYFIFYIYEPKKRMIMSISFRHRIIQWAIYRVLNPIRYMDDVIILSDDKIQLRSWKDRIEAFLLEELELNLNKKTCIRPISQGIEFVGYRLWPNRVVIRKSTSLRIKRALRGMRVKYSRYEVTFQDVTETLQSYLGMLEHCDSEPLVKSILDNLVLTHADQTEEVIYEQTGAA